MNRRNLIALLTTTALAACAGQTAAQIAQTVVADAQLVANALSNVLPNLQGVPPDVSGAVAMYAQKATAAAQSLVTTMTQAAAQPIIQQIQTDANAVADQVRPYLKQGSQAAQIMADVQLLLPVLLLAVGLAAPSAATPGASPDTARARLAVLPTRG